MAVRNIYDEPNNSLIQVMYMNIQVNILFVSTTVTPTAFRC